MDDSKTEDCPTCRGITVARLEPAQAARVPRVFCSSCHRRVEIVLATGGGRAFTPARYTDEAA